MIEAVDINLKSFEAMFLDFNEGLGRYAFSIVKDQMISEDIVQKVFLKIWEKRKELEIQDLKSYLFRAVYNSSLNEIKKMKKNQLHVDIDESASVRSASQASDTVLKEELQIKIDKAISTLPLKCSEVFRLSRYSELSYKEISEKLNISVKTVENHMGKALKLMRIEMKEYLSEVLVIILLLKGW